MQVGDRARLAEAARADDRQPGGQTARPRTAHRHRAGKRQRRHAAVRRHRPRAGRHPARPPRRHHRHHRRPDARHARRKTGRCPRRRAAERADPRARARKPTAASASSRRRATASSARPRHAARRHRGPRRPAHRRLRAPHHPPRRRAAERRQRADRPRAADRPADHPRRPHAWSNSPPSRCPARSRTLNNRAVVEINGVRDRLRVLLISGEPHPGERTWRRLLKADPVGRSGAFHHPAAAREGRPDAAERAGADRLSGARAVPRQDRRVRPDHPRPLPEPRPAAAALYRATSPTTCATAARCCSASGPEFSGAASLAATPLGSVLPGRPAPFGAVVDGRFRPLVTALGQRHPVTEGLAGRQPAGSRAAVDRADLGRLVPPHRAAPTCMARC